MCLCYRAVKAPGVRTPPTSTSGPRAHTLFRHIRLRSSHVLAPIGADDFGILFTRDEDPSDRTPILGLGAVPTLDHAAKIARLIFNEGEHDGTQLLNRSTIREALGRTEWEGYPAFSGLRYGHSF